MASWVVGPPAERSNDNIEVIISSPFYLNYTSFAPQRQTPSASSKPSKKHPSHDHQTRLTRSHPPIVPTKDPQKIHPPYVRLFRSQTPRKVRFQEPSQPPKPPDRKNSPKYPKEPSSSSTHTKDPPIRIPLHHQQQEQNDTNNTRLFDNDYYNSGKMEDVRQHIVDKYIVDQYIATTKEQLDGSIEAPSTVSDCETGFSNDNRRISSLTMQSSQVAPRAPGEDRSFTPRDRGLLQMFEQDYFFGRSKVLTEDKLQQMEYNSLSSIDHQLVGATSPPSEFVYDSIPIEEHQQDYEAPSSPSQYKESKIIIPTKTPTFPTNKVIKSFISVASDERSKSSQKTVKSLLSAKFAVVLPSRRSGSANHPLVRSEPLPEDELQEEHPMTKRFFSFSACLCVAMIIGAILFVTLVPRGVGKRHFPKIRHPKSHVDHQQEQFHKNIFVGKS